MNLSRTSLRLRITAATAVAVAAVAAAIGVIGYLSVRSHLRGQIDAALTDRVQPILQPRPLLLTKLAGPLPGLSTRPVPPGLEAPPEVSIQGPAGTVRVVHRASEGGTVRVVHRASEGGLPPGPLGLGGVAFTLPFGPAAQAGLVSKEPPPSPFGGASGFFQFVSSNGGVISKGGPSPRLPVDARAHQIASLGNGRYFTDEWVGGTHLRVLTVADPYDHAAVQVARPLTEVDQVLHELTVVFALLVGGGIAVAALLGTSIGRAALAPIAQFTRRTEAVSGALDGSQRLEEAGASELARLARSFNRTLEALERSVQAQRHLVADASHELRTPMAALRSNIQVFLQAHRLPLHEREALQASVLAELDELTRLVADVVELARGAEPTEQPEPIELHRVIEETVERARRRSPGIRYDLDLEPTMIQAVPDRIARALTNVLDNAREWSPPDGRIELRLRDGTLWVRDHGPGFEERDLPYVFDRFYRADGARRRPGSGLGLAIVRQAVEAYGGTVRAQNAPGGGALVSASFAPGA